jgi:Flp pilus assembly pilin Flp
MMMQRMHELITGEDGQDLIEYTLLLAFVLFTVIGLTTGMGNSVKGITSVSNSQIAFANNMVS